MIFHLPDNAISKTNIAADASRVCGSFFDHCYFNSLKSAFMAG